MNNERLFGKLIKTVLPLTGKLPECSFCYKQYTAAGEKPTLKTKALISSDIILSVYPFFASVHRTFTKIMVDHTKNSLNEVKRTEILQSLFSDHNEIKLETNNRKIRIFLNA